MSEWQDIKEFLQKPLPVWAFLLFALADGMWKLATESKIRDLALKLIGR